MKSTPDKPNFEDALRQVLSVSKEELNHDSALLGECDVCPPDILTGCRNDSR